MENGEISRYKDLGRLHDLLLDVCPPDEKGTKSIVVLAGKLGVSYQYIYRWIDLNQVPAKFVRQLVDLSGGRVPFDRFHEFVFA